MSGDSATVTMQGATKVIELLDYGPSSVEVTVDLSEGDPLFGTADAWFEIAVSGEVEVRGGGVNPVTTEVWPDEEVYQDLLSGSFTDALANAVYTRPIEVLGASSLTVAIEEVSECSDLDLAVWYDANMNGVADDATYWYVGAGGSSESLTITDPADGQYLVKVLGYTVEGDPGVFSLTVSKGVAGAEMYAIGLPMFAETGVTEFEVYYEVPATVGTYAGAATFGFMGADDMFSIDVVVHVVE